MNNSDNNNNCTRLVVNGLNALIQQGEFCYTKSKLNSI